MNIPNRVKIGGLTYDIEFTDNISREFSAEIDYFNLKIRIRPEMKPEKQKRDFLHEIIHGILYELGYSEHNEKEVDEFAGALYALIVDNPELFEKVGEQNG